MMQARTAKRVPNGTDVLRQLDLIVSQVFANLEAEAVNEQKDFEAASPLVANRSKSRKTSATRAQREVLPAAPTEMHGQPEPLRAKAAKPSTPAWETEQSEEAEAEEPQPEAKGDDPDLSLLMPDEEEFVTRTIAWLNSHPNPDILLDRIWTLAIEARSAEPCGSAGKTDADSEVPDEHQ